MRSASQFAKPFLKSYMSLYCSKQPSEGDAVSSSQTGLLTAQNFPELWLICSALLQKLSTAPCRETGYTEGPPTLSHQHRGTDWLPVCPPLSRHFGYLFSAPGPFPPPSHDRGHTHCLGPRSLCSWRLAHSAPCHRVSVTGWEAHSGPGPVSVPLLPTCSCRPWRRCSGVCCISPFPGTVMHTLRKGELGLCAEGCVAGTAAV